MYIGITPFCRYRLNLCTNSVKANEQKKEEGNCQVFFMIGVSCFSAQNQLDNIKIPGKEIFPENAFVAKKYPINKAFKRSE